MHDKKHTSCLVLTLDFHGILCQIVKDHEMIFDSIVVTKITTEVHST